MRAPLSGLLALGLLLAACTVSGRSLASDGLQAGVVHTLRLNLRAEPGGRGTVIAELPMATPILVHPDPQGPWYKISALISRKVLTGWVHGNYITITGTAPEPSAPKASPAPLSAASPDPALPIGRSLPPRYGYDSPLSISSADLECRDSYFDNGLEDCEVDIRVRYSGHPDVEGNFTVNCTVEAHLDFKDSYYTPSRSFDGSGSLWVTSGYGSTSISVDIDKGFSIEPLLKVQVTDTRCRYSR